MSVFRPLYVELSDDAYAIAKGILEQALIKAQPCARYSRPSAASLFGQLFESSAGRVVCDEFGWQSATMYREPMDRSTTLTAKLNCGHRSSVTFTDHLVETEPRLVDLLVSLGRGVHGARRCYCVPREAA